MMREILFRGKTEYSGRWVQGDLYKSSKSVFIMANNADSYAKTNYAVHPETVGQYTGLTDQNGTKIFEGDILKVDNGKRNSIVTVKYGCFRPEMFFDAYESISCRELKGKAFGLYGEAFSRINNRLEQLLIIDNTHFIEVIGNIHDNPELIGGAENG